MNEKYRRVYYMFKNFVIQKFLVKVILGAIWLCGVLLKNQRTKALVFTSRV